MPGSVCNSPSLMSGATPMLSRLSALMCRQKGLVLLFSKEALLVLRMCVGSVRGTSNGFSGIGFICEATGSFVTVYSVSLLNINNTINPIA